MAQHNDTGKWGEKIACDILKEEGAIIREQNKRFGGVEIDIIASTGSQIIFAEVKTRTDPAEDPFDAIDNKKILRMVRAAEAYIRTCEVPLEPRFDVFGIRGTEEEHTVEHIPDAFHAPLRTY